jgi:hypothetical protein
MSDVRRNRQDLIGGIASWPRCPAGVLFTFRNKTRPSELTPSRSLQLAFSWESQITYLVYIILSVTAY